MLSNNNKENKYSNSTSTAKVLSSPIGKDADPLANPPHEPHEIVKALTDDNKNEIKKKLQQRLALLKSKKGELSHERTTSQLARFLTNVLTATTITDEQKVFATQELLLYAFEKGIDLRKKIAVTRIKDPGSEGYTYNPSFLYLAYLNNNPLCTALLHQAGFQFYNLHLSITDRLFRARSQTENKATDHSKDIILMYLYNSMSTYSEQTVLKKLLNGEEKEKEASPYFGNDNKEASPYFGNDNKEIAENIINISRHFFRYNCYFQYISDSWNDDHQIFAGDKFRQFAKDFVTIKEDGTYNAQTFIAQYQPGLAGPFLSELESFSASIKKGEIPEQVKIYQQLAQLRTLPCRIIDHIVATQAKQKEDPKPELTRAKLEAAFHLANELHQADKYIEENKTTDIREVNKYIFEKEFSFILNTPGDENHCDEEEEKTETQKSTILDILKMHRDGGKEYFLKPNPTTYTIVNDAMPLPKKPWFKLEACSAKPLTNNSRPDVKL